MNRALITKYLSSVKNDDLPIFGAIVINSNPSIDTDMVVDVTTTEPFNVSELGGAEILDENTRQPITSSVIGHKVLRIIQDTSKTMHLIFNGIKYKPVLTDTITCFGCILDLSALKYQSNLSAIQMGTASQSIGSLSDLPSGITSLGLGSNSLVTGNIKDLPSGITYLGLSNSSSITGTLESYVEKLYNAHKNDGKDFTLSAHTEVTGVTFNGASANYLSTTTISGGKATVRKGEQGNILGTYDGTSWTYNS